MEEKELDEIYTLVELSGISNGKVKDKK